ncbi:MAG: transposase [Bacteroidetes bacterium]|nr:transposase [Bacteroidota bacterium]
MRKHFTVDVREDGFPWRRDAESVAAEEAPDGFYVIRTSLPESVMAAGETVRAYKSLARVERAFRTMKTVDLKVRPVHHRLAGRVRAHVLLRMLAHYVEWHMREALKPLPVHDGEPAAAASPVAPAEPSDAAALKAASGRTASGLPAQGFQGLMAHLAHLATLSRLRVRPRSESAAEFEMTSTPLQAEAFRLLGVRIP